MDLVVRSNLRDISWHRTLTSSPFFPACQELSLRILHAHHCIESCSEDFVPYHDEALVEKMFTSSLRMALGQFCFTSIQRSAKSNKKNKYQRGKKQRKTNCTKWSLPSDLGVRAKPGLKKRSPKSSTGTRRWGLSCNVPFRAFWFFLGFLAGDGRSK